MTIWVVIWVVLMMFWLFGYGYVSYDPGRPHMILGTILPWLCVLILGLILFGAVSPGPVIVQR
jgi:hypothetical protein